MTMNLLLWLSFASGCSSLTVPPQKPLGLGRIQEHVEKLSWDEDLHCVPTISSAGNDTVCVQAVPYKEVHDPVILGPPQYCGYVTLAYDKNKMFFWLVMSETGDPTTQPVVLWLNGGPGVSSLLGLWDQWGPRLFDHSKPGVAFLDNMSKLTEKMTWIFLDQPANVGYSRTKPGGPRIKDSVAAAQDIVAFLDGILNTALFTFKGSNISLFAAPLHVAGESYAGHFIPAFGAEMAARQGQFNLTSLFIGNGLVDAAKFGPGVNELLCGPEAPTASFGISQSASLSSQCSIQTRRIIDCSVEISNCRAAPTGTAKATACGNANAACIDSWGWAWGSALSRNQYDGTTDRNHILSQFSYYNTPAKTFLNEPTRKARFGVSKSTNWQWYNSVVRGEFDDSGDWFRSYIPEIGTALSAGIDVMLYVVSISTKFSQS
jgi:cathepsin A (carboxypeptidase C)